jgi:hypothetical protein
MTRKKIVLLTVSSVAAGAVIALGATGIALAATGGLHGPQQRGGVHSDEHGGAPSGMPGAERGGPGQDDADGPGGNGRRGGMGDRGGMGGLRGALEGMRGALPLHSETVVKQQDGTILTIVGVSGKVSAVSPTSITIAAEDGFSATYAVDTDTEIGKDHQQASIVDVVVGDSAMAIATEVDGSTTAERILVGDLSGGHDGPMGRGLDSEQGDASPASPSPSA